MNFYSPEPPADTMQEVATHVLGIADPGEDVRGRTGPYPPPEDEHLHSEGNRGIQPTPLLRVQIANA